MRRVIVGFVWFLVLYFGACMVTGAIAATVAVKELPKNASRTQVNRVTFAASAAAVSGLRVYFFTGALVISIVGSTSGYLPGTRPAALPLIAHQTEIGPESIPTVSAPIGLSHTGNLRLPSHESAQTGLSETSPDASPFQASD